MFPDNVVFYPVVAEVGYLTDDEKTGFRDYEMKTKYVIILKPIVLCKFT